MDSKALHRFDLNLIKVFLAICEGGSLTAAATRLGLTQPAISHALRRLREDFGDPLFVRVGNGMEPTRAARALRPAFEEVLRIVADTMYESRAFDPATATRHFRIAMSDTGEFVVLPRLIEALNREAPQVRVQSIRVHPDDLSAALRSGQVDAAVKYQPLLEQGGNLGRRLLRDRIVCLYRAGHPDAGADWNAETFAAQSFIDVGRDATGYRMAREFISELGVPYRMAAQVDHFTIVPEILRRTDFVALFPWSACQMVNRHGAFGHVEVPFAVPQFDVDYWVNDAFAADPGLNWLYQLLKRAMET